MWDINLRYFLNRVKQIREVKVISKKMIRVVQGIKILNIRKYE